MTLNEEIKTTVNKALGYKQLFIIFLLINILALTLILQLRSFSMPLVALLFLITQPLQIFLYAGFNGITFIKINSKQIDINDFFRLARKCFWSFVKIAIIIAIIGGIFNWSLNKLLLFISEQYHTKAMSYFFTLTHPVIELFFIFAYPLVILEYFSQNKLHPVKTSISLVVKKASKIKLVYLIIGIQLSLSLLKAFITDNPIEDNTYLFMLIIQWPLSFLLLIYSYMRLSDCFYKDMEFDFERHLA